MLSTTAADNVLFIFVCVCGRVGGGGGKGGGGRSGQRHILRENKAWHFISNFML